MRGYARIKTVCKYADISKTTLRNWIKDGLRYTKVKGIVLFKHSDIDNYINQYSDDSETKSTAIVNDVINDLSFN
ncbi:MAG: helix-turn-helix domain-containing protein [Candidatus Magnetomorum sp.]|nr:helix-turn-helix domain-containing protein [Candidatus Magnetomorum sp.]